MFSNYDWFFIYKGKGYLVGSVVKFKQEYLDYATYNGQKIWKYGFFSAKIGDDGDEKYTFSICKTDPYIESQHCAPRCVIPKKDIETAIEEIIEPKEIEIVPKTKKKDYECNEVMVGWIIYIAVLLGSFIFRDWITAWVFASIYFFAWRSHKLWED